MGRKKLPTHLKIVKGTSRKDRENKNEPFPETEIPPAPDHLSKEALIEWGRITADLYSMGLLTKIDRASLAAYCQSWGRWVQAETALAKSEDEGGGLVIITDKGNIIQSPLVGIANQAMEHMRKHLANFGMSPADRAKVTAKKSEEKTNPFSKYGS